MGALWTGDADRPRSVRRRNGRVQTWSHDVWSFTHVGRPMPFHEGSELVAAWHLAKPLPRVPPTPRLGPEVGIHRNAWPLYRFPQTRVVKRFVKDSPLRTSSLRGLGAHANVFAIESFMDELAALPVLIRPNSGCATSTMPCA